MSKPIVIGVDGSEPSRAAVSWGLEQARLRAAPVLLFFVCDMTPFADTPSLVDEALEVGQRLLDHEVELARAEAPDLTVDGQIALGLPVRQFEDISSLAQLVVVGTHKGVLLQNAIFGTRGIRIAAVSKAPVAVIPRIDLEGRSGIVVGVDGTDAGQAALEFAAAEAARVNEPLTLVAVWSMPVMSGLDYVWSPEIGDATRQVAVDVLNDAREWISAHVEGVTVESVVFDGVVVDRLVAEAKSARLLVVGNRGRRGLSRLLLGSTSHGVLNNITSPVVVIKAPEPSAPATGAVA